MKIKSSYLFLFFSMFFSLYSFAAPTVTTAAKPSVNLTEAQKTDGKIMETLVVINANEIKAAKLAITKSANSDVKRFAQVMIRDHSKNFIATKLLSRKIGIPLISSDKSNSLVKAGKDELASLQKENNKEFNQDYINDMVKGHEAALKFLDDSLHHATNPDLIKHLKSTREAVMHHLQMAKDTRSKM